MQALIFKAFLMYTFQFSRPPVLPGGRDFLLYKQHLFHAITANDVDLFCSPYAVATTGALIFPGAAGLRWSGFPGLASRLAAYASGTKTFIPAHPNIIPAFHNNEVDQCLRGLCDTPANAGIIGNV